ncbi:MAG: ABC transporter permease [Candidatus Thermofonsia Clade 1 bacterium]|uniref:ABC transporter permease n=1 Tax=Candidatus Thermofonsia Clade 1 bacterium TaxID=2364210 RepID=A0A2M8NYC3_9CHLR|nr:MAG: ABC transporter permease [Candidatus Thermofonsia Clade 1 bacterium]
MRIVALGRGTAAAGSLKQTLAYGSLALPFALIVLSLMLGLYEIRIETVIRALLWLIVPQAAEGIPSTELTLILRIRLPRILSAALIGAALASTGAAFQGIFKNPLVDSNLLGVTSGAGFGAAIALLLGGTALIVQGSAFAFGLLAVLVAYAGSRLYSSAPLIVLTLMGILIGSFFTSLTALTKYVADPLNTLPAITFWLLGGLTGVTWNSLPLLALITLGGSAFLWAIRWRLNILSLGDAEATALGMNPARLKLLIILCATLMTASAVAVGGVIGWIGLVIPHAARLLVGADHKALIPTSLALGASFLLVIDNISRTLLPAEVPLGILTGLVGVPILIVLLRRSQSVW